MMARSITVERSVPALLGLARVSGVGMGMGMGLLGGPKRKFDLTARYLEASRDASARIARICQSGEMASDEDKLLRQLEFYMSDASLPYDTFLAGELRRSEADATVSVSAATLAGFPRVVALLPDLSAEERAEALVAAAARSDTLRACDGGHIGRRFPLPADDPAADHSVFLEGLPPSADEAAVLEVLAACVPDAAPASTRRLRDLKDDRQARAFSGKWHVELADAAAAQAVVDAAAAKSLRKPGGQALRATLLRAHYEAEAAKVAEYRRKTAEKQAKRKAEAEAAEAEAGRASSGAGSCECGTCAGAAADPSCRRCGTRTRSTARYFVSRAGRRTGRRCPTPVLSRIVKT